MNCSPPSNVMNKREFLLAETVGDGDGEQFALVAASHARRRRVFRQASLAVGASLATIAALFVVRQSPPEPAAIAPPPSPVIEIISDEELLVQLKDQPVLLLKDRTGITGVIFLADRTTPAKDISDRNRF